MIEVREVVSNREKRDFLEFANRLYKGNPCFVPALYQDEKKIFRKDYVYYDTSEAVYYIAYRNGKPVGRISGILQKASNEKMGTRRVRFTRFDCIEDFEVAEALFGKLESWALSKGMDTVVGPLGFSDLEREGLLIDGFDQENTFEEQYNAPYYKDFIERLGYVKEVDWVEYRIFPPTAGQEAEFEKLSDAVMKRYNLHRGEASGASDFLRKYKDGFFSVLDKSYEHIYGTVPFTEGMKKLMIDNFKLIIDQRYAAVILDENENVVLMAIAFPSIARMMRLGGGHLTPRAVLEFLRIRRRPEVLDLGLIGVDPQWANRGVGICAMAILAKMLRVKGTRYAETNLNLEDNHIIQNFWKRFDAVLNKRRRSYVKTLI